MKALVTGGAGFLGSGVVDRLLAEGHAVDVVDDLSTGSLVNLADARADRSAELRIHQADVRSPDLGDLVARRDPDVVFHLAGGREPEACVVAGLRVVEAALGAGVAKVVVAVGPSAAPAGDHPASVQGIVERAVVDLLRLHRERSGLEFTALVLGTVYGPRQRDGAGVVATFAHRLLAGEPCPLPGDGSQAHDFVYVDDAVDAVVRAGERGGGLVLPVATGKPTAVADLHRLMVEACGTDPGVVPVRAPLDPPLPDGRLDPSRTRLHLGWSAWTPLPEGVAATLRWVAGTAASPA